MRYEILDDGGQVVNVIVADEAFVSERYPGMYRALPDTWRDERAEIERSALAEKQFLALIDSRADKLEKEGKPIEAFNLRRKFYGEVFV